MKAVRKHPHHLIPDMFYFKEIDDLPFYKITVFNLFPCCLPKVKGSAEQSRFEMNMAAQSDVIEHGCPLEKLKFLECP